MTNFSEFWRVWHASLYHFFREHLFKRLLLIPFYRTHVALAVMSVMLVSTVWHGVGWGVSRLGSRVWVADDCLPLGPAAC